MSIVKTFAVAGALALVSSVPAAAERSGPFIASYAGIGAGAASVSGAALPAVSLSGGLRLSPWWSLGMFVEGVPLSDFEHAGVGLAAADRENSYMAASGTELLFTPLSGSALHPLFRVALGGASAGYLADTDGEEGFEEAREKRYFFASASVGFELSLARFWRLTARVGGRFVGNGELLGIGAGGLSGAEAFVGARLLYGILFE